MSRKVVAELRNVTRTFYMGQSKVHALTDVSISVYERDMLALAGPSGSGKSTILHLFGCIDKPTSGKILIDGIDTTPQNLEELTKIRSEKIGFIFQTFNLIPVLTAFENVELPLLFQRSDKRSIKEEVMEALNKVGLLDRKDHYPDMLSGGQRQRTAIARALVGNPTLILADEPTANLDSKTGAEVLDLLLKLNQEEKATIVISTHDVEILARLNHIIKVRDGKREL